MFVPAALRNVALSHLAGKNDDMSANKQVLKRMTQINLVTTLIPFSVIAILSGWICSWYGESYDGMQSVLNVCMFTTVINSITNVLTQNLIAMDQNWYLFWTRLMRDLVTIGVAALLIFYFDKGALMYAIACLCFQFFYMILLTCKQKSIYRNM